MPVAIPLVAGYAASAAAATVFTSAITVSAIGAVGALVGSAIAGAAFPPKQDTPDVSSALNQPGAGRTQQIRQPISPHQIPFGRYKTSGPMLFVNTQDDPDGRPNGFFYIVHGLSSTHIKHIGDTYLNQTISTDPAFVNQVTFVKHLGETDQVADIMLVTETAGAWADDRWLRGRAYVASKLIYDQTAFSTGMPNLSWMVDGDDQVFDPRTNTFGFTNNAALLIARWLIAPYGMAIAWEDLDEDTLIASANTCAERVLVKPKVWEFQAATTGSFTFDQASAKVLDWGDGVRFSSSGSLPSGLSADTTYYAIPSDGNTYRFATSAPGAFAEAYIAPVDTGSGSHFVTTWDEARYKLNGSFTLDAEKGEVLQQLLTSMAGQIIYIGGKWFIHAGAPGFATVEFTDDDLRAEPEVVPKRSMRDRMNGVRAVYVSPDANWQPTDAPPLLPTDELLAEDNGGELIQDIRLPFVTSTPQAQRLMKVALGRNRQQMTVKWPCKLSGMLVQAWDCVTLHSDRWPFLNNRTFRVTSWALAEDNGIDLLLQEEDSTVWDWSIDDEQDTADLQGVVLPGTTAVAPTIAVTTPPDTAPDHLFLTWNETAGPGSTGYEVQYRTNGVVTWTSSGTIPAGDEPKALIPREPPQDIRLRTVGATVSTWTTSLAPSPPTGLTSSTVGQLEWTTGTGADHYQLFKDSAIWNNAVPVSPTVLAGLNDGTYTMRSVSVDGNISAMSAAFTLSGAGTGTGGTDSITERPGDE